VRQLTDSDFVTPEKSGCTICGEITFFKIAICFLSILVPWVELEALINGIDHFYVK